MNGDCPNSDTYEGTMDYLFNGTVAPPNYQEYPPFSWSLPSGSVRGYNEHNQIICSEPVNHIIPAITVGSFPTAPVTGSRVHVNPNFMSRTVGRSEKECGTSKPANVYINPHWKRKSISTTNVEVKKSSVSSTSVRKTIFINPRLLAQMQPQTMCDKSFNFVPLAPSDPVEAHTIDESVMENWSQAAPFLKKIPEDVSTLKTAVLLSSHENVSDTADKHQKSSIEGTLTKPISRIQESDSTQLIKNNTRPFNSLTDTSSKLKVAKQIRSKYKLVRNNPAQMNSTFMKAMPTNCNRRAKKKPVSLKSPFKFVKKDEWGRSTTKLSSRYKVVNKRGISTNQLHVYQNVQNNKTFYPQKLKKINNGNKVVKSRYRLVKDSSTPQPMKLSAEGRVKKLNSRYKLICVNSSEAPAVPKSSTQCRVFQPSSASFPIKSQFKIVRHTSQSKFTPVRKVSRYRIVQGSGLKYKVRLPQSSSKFVRNMSGSFPPMSGVKRSFPFCNGNKVWQSRRMLQSSFLLHNKHKLQRIYSGGSITHGSSVSATKSKSNLLSIGGVLYRSTPTSLTLARTYGSSEKVLHIRGRKFILDSKRTTLRPITEACEVSKLHSQTPLSRVDIGGITYIRRDDNTLVRTNTHFTRSLLSFAKMKSIALLTAKLRKNNQPCLIYHRFGKCLAHEKGKCWRVHDPKNISICQKFLQGCCEIEGCLLSHNVGPEKMPTCRYFLGGCCVRDGCPYLHVKLSANAAICKQFLDGYCAAGDMCTKRHINICPNFEQDKKCPKGKYCPYPHPKLLKTKVKKKRVSVSASACKGNAIELLVSEHSNHKVSSSTGSCKIPSDLLTVCKEVDKRQRYYHDSGTSVKPPEGEEVYSIALRGKRHRILKQIDHLKKMRQGLLTNTDNSNSSDDDVCDEELSKRPALGVLPAYIPLE